MTNFNIKEELKKLPDSPGVYMHKDSLGEIIYVGKAVNLKNRVRQYFQKTSQTNPKVRAMVSNIAEFEYISCATEMEALLLECNLIKKHQPKYNVLLKDDKTYPYIMITLSEDFPRIIRTRRVEKDSNKYFGPYSDVNSMNRIIKMIEEMYPLKRCKAKKFPKGVRPCLNYFIGRCKGVCLGNVNKDEYRKMIDEIIDILSSHDSAIISDLKNKMNKASSELKYEEAAKYRDYIEALKQLGETQRASMVRDRELDIIIPVNTNKNKIVALYKVRDGKLVSRDIIYVKNNEGVSDEDKDIISGFIKMYYSSSNSLPKEIIIPNHIDDESLLEDMLLNKTKFIVPERGERRALLKMALADSEELSKSIDERAELEEERKNSLRDSLKEVIEYACKIDNSIPLLIPDGDEREYRIEAYDISNLNGLDTVGAMVVYEGRRPLRKDYRKFKVRTAEGDDYGSLREVIYRRLKRAKANDAAFSILPDIMFIDGGLGQVRAVKTVMDAFRISIPVVGLAKDDFHRTRAIVFNDGHEIELKKNRLLFSYCGMIQEEVHRFAITYMSGVRGKKMIHSVLEDIPGVGPKRRKLLLEHFGDITNIKKASYDDLTKLAGITDKVAENIISYLN